MEKADEKELDETMETLADAAARLLAGLDARTAGKRRNVRRIHIAANDEFGQPQWDWDE